jgi:uncharacterized protein (DUF983 family)
MSPTPSPSAGSSSTARNPSFIPPPREVIFLRATRGRCPRCNHAGIFASRFRLHERCPCCGLPLELEDGWSYGSVPLAYSLACIWWVLPIALLAVGGILPVWLALSLEPIDIQYT